MKIKEPELYALFSKNIVESLTHIESHEKIQQKWLHNKDEDHNIWLIILKNFTNLQKLNSFLAIEQWCQTKPWVKKHFDNYVGFGFVLGKPAIDDILRRCVYEHIMKKGLRPHQQTIDKMYQKLESFLKSSTITVFSNTLVSGLQLDDDIVVESGLEIRKLDEDEKYEYNKQLNYWEPHPSTIIVYGRQFKKLFAKNTIQPKKIYREYRDTMNLPLKLITALRIFKRGRFGVTMHYEFSNYLHHQKSDPEEYGVKKLQFSLTEHDYKFIMSEYDVFRIFWAQYKSLPHTSKYAFIHSAIHRFMDIYRREDLADRVLDLMISLEILFTVGETKSKLLKKRISKFLEPINQQERGQIYRFMGVAYDLRSSIVHGGDKVDFFLDGERIEIWDIEKKLESVVRTCIQKLVHIISTDHRTKKQILMDLDKERYVANVTPK